MEPPLQLQSTTIGVGLVVVGAIRVGSIVGLGVTVGCGVTDAGASGRA